MKHILSVDDDYRIRELLFDYLTDHGYYVNTVESAKRAESLLELFDFDIMILDIMMPGEDGIEFLQRIRKKNPIRQNMPVLLLSAKGEVEHRIAGLEKGADEYLPKPFEPRELLLRIGNILKRSQKKSGFIISFGNFTFDCQKMTLYQGEKFIFLNEVEKNLMRFLLTKPDLMHSRKELSDFLNTGNPRSVDVAISRMRQKIEKDPRAPQFLQTVRGKGYAMNIYDGEQIKPIIEKTQSANNHPRE